MFITTILKVQAKDDIHLATYIFTNVNLARGPHIEKKQYTRIVI